MEEEDEPLVPSRPSKPMLNAFDPNVPEQSNEYGSGLARLLKRLPSPAEDCSFKRIFNLNNLLRGW